MFTRSLLLGITAGLLSGIACMVFAMVYKETQFVDFSVLIGPVNYIGACVFGCVLASIGFWASVKVMPKYGEIVFNFLFTILTFASILGPIGYTWPPEAATNDEVSMAIDYFSVFAITLHFFPAIVWYTLKPVFIKR
jgi:hypothetical protein